MSYGNFRSQQLRILLSPLVVSIRAISLLGKVSRFERWCTMEPSMINKTRLRVRAIWVLNN